MLIIIIPCLHRYITFCIHSQYSRFKCHLSLLRFLPLNYVTMFVLPNGWNKDSHSFQHATTVPNPPAVPNKCLLAKYKVHRLFNSQIYSLTRVYQQNIRAKIQVKHDEELFSNRLIHTWFWGRVFSYTNIDICPSPIALTCDRCRSASYSIILYTL